MKNKVRHLTLTATAATPARTSEWINKHGAEVEVLESHNKYEVVVARVKASYVVAGGMMNCTTPWTRIKPNLLHMECSESGREVIHANNGLYINEEGGVDFRPW